MNIKEALEINPDYFTSVDEIIEALRTLQEEFKKLKDEAEKYIDFGDYYD